MVKIILLFRSQKIQRCLTRIAVNLGQSFEEWVRGDFFHVKRKARKDISVWPTLPLVTPCFWKKEVRTMTLEFLYILIIIISQAKNQKKR